MARVRWWIGGWAACNDKRSRRGYTSVMRYRVQHTTRYAYGTPVELAAHMVHLRPRPQRWQTVISERIVTDPAPARRRDGLDHCGNHVTWLFMDMPHADFDVTSEAVVEVDREPP